VLVLVVDSSTPAVTAAVARIGDGEPEVLAERRTVDGRAHGELLAPHIEAALAQVGARPRDLGAIVAGLGPGPFTGLRVGLAAARGLGLTLGIPVLGIPTLTALSLAGQGAFAVIVDARRNEAYCQLFAGPGTPAAAAEVVPFDAPPVPPGLPIVSGNPVDIGLLAAFAANADPALYPPDAFYLRSADAKPQDKARIARVRA
jgi:tRNA threonylcarbamoyl adenosine modification protein YeaZ